jgi:hypothetical protein
MKATKTMIIKRVLRLFCAICLRMETAIYIIIPRKTPHQWCGVGLEEYAAENSLKLGALVLHNFANALVEFILE